MESTKTSEKRLRKSINCKLITTSEYYPDRIEIIPYKPSVMGYDKIINAKKNLKIFYNKKGISYLFKPSTEYTQFKKNKDNCIFAINKKQILSNTKFLDSILSKLYTIQVNE